MIFGMTPYTFIHVVISLVGILAGVVVLGGLLASKSCEVWTELFLGTTAATCITGFFFPFHGLKPSYIVGVLTLIVLAMAAVARYRHAMSGSWRLTYVIGMMLAFYFNTFVLVVQSFLKIPALNALAPTQTEPAFKLTQLVVLVLFIILGALASVRFHPAPALAKS
jgi:hypothetical protein